MDKLKQAILDYIVQIQGCKATELMVAVAGVEGSADAVQAAEELVAEGSIMEIEYTVPNLPDRIKSFYLPKDSEILTIPEEFRKEMRWPA